MALQRKYQVFVSSTFRDLENARREVSEALLRTDCFPAGMELFPAVDESQFDYIRGVISESDYYLIISAGKYGSIESKSGKSYTELEYDFAVSIGKPIIRLLHIDPFGSLKGADIEASDKGREALESFRNKMVENRLVRFWGSAAELKTEAIFGILECQRRFPSSGWVKFDGLGLSNEDLAVERQSKASDVVLNTISRMKSASIKLGNQKVSLVDVFLASYPAFVSGRRAHTSSYDYAVRALLPLVSEDNTEFREYLKSDDIHSSDPGSFDTDTLVAELDVFGLTRLDTSTDMGIDAYVYVSDLGLEIYRLLKEQSRDKNLGS